MMRGGAERKQYSKVKMGINSVLMFHTAEGKLLIPSTSLFPNHRKQTNSLTDLSQGPPALVLTESRKKKPFETGKTFHT